MYKTKVTFDFGRILSVYLSILFHCTCTYTKKIVYKTFYQIFFIKLMMFGHFLKTRHL